MIDHYGGMRFVLMLRHGQSCWFMSFDNMILNITLG